MSEFTPLIGKTLKYLHPEQREAQDDKGRTFIQHRLGQFSGRVELEIPLRRQVQIGQSLHRFEDVTIVEVDGEPYAQFLARTQAPPAPKAAITRWNPLSKVVQNHETGDVHEAATNFIRHELKLPVPWRRSMIEEDIATPAVTLTPEQTALVALALEEKA